MILPSLRARYDSEPAFPFCDQTCLEAYLVHMENPAWLNPEPIQYDWSHEFMMCENCEVNIWQDGSRSVVVAKSEVKAAEHSMLIQKILNLIEEQIEAKCFGKFRLLIGKGIEAICEESYLKHSNGYSVSVRERMLQIEAILEVATDKQLRPQEMKLQVDPRSVFSWSEGPYERKTLWEKIFGKWRADR